MPVVDLHLLRRPPELEIGQEDEARARRPAVQRLRQGVDDPGVPIGDRERAAVGALALVVERVRQPDVDDVQLGMRLAVAHDRLDERVERGLEAVA